MKKYDDELHNLEDYPDALYDLEYYPEDLDDDIAYNDYLHFLREVNASETEPEIIFSTGGYAALTSYIIFDGDWNIYKNVQYHLMQAKEQIDVCMYFVTYQILYDFLEPIRKTKPYLPIRILLHDNIHNNRLKTPYVPPKGEIYNKIRAFSVANQIEYLTKLEQIGVKPFFLQTTKNILMHHKFCVVDHSLSMLGSCNWTFSGFSKNKENSLFTYDRSIAEQLTITFENLINEAFNQPHNFIR